MPTGIDIVVYLVAWVFILLIVAAVLDRWCERRRLRLLLNRSADTPHDTVRVATWDEVATALANGYLVTAGAVPDGPVPESCNVYPCGDGEHRHRTAIEAHACFLDRSVWEDEGVAS